LRGAAPVVSPPGRRSGWRGHRGGAKGSPARTAAGAGEATQRARPSAIVPEPSLRARCGFDRSLVLGMARTRAAGLSPSPPAVTLLLDPQFLVWLVLRSRRLARFPWLERHRPWGVSPVSLLEIQFLAENGRLSVRNPEFVDTVMNDARFTVDDVPSLTLARSALAIGWTRDPFDRLLVAHSLARRVPLCTTDRLIHEHHRLIAQELAQ